jgi:hypothetical protein
MPIKVKRAGSEEYGHTLKMLVAGEPGAGKTRMSSTFPNVFYANVEGGLMSVADRQVPYTDITSSEDLNQLLQHLRQPPRLREAALGVPVSTIIIDTLDAVQKMLIEERKRSEKKDSMAIADWGWLGDQIRLIVRNYRNLEMNVIFTCHLKTESDAETGATFVKPALQGAMGDEIAAYVDIAGLLKASPISVVKDGKTIRVLQRLLQTGPDSRHPWLKDRSGKLAIERDVNLTNDGMALLAIIFNTDAVAPSELVHPTAPTEVAEQPAPPVPAAKPAARRGRPPKPVGKVDEYEIAPTPATEESGPEPEVPSQPGGQVESEDELLARLAAETGQQELNAPEEPAESPTDALVIADDLSEIPLDDPKLTLVPEEPAPSGRDAVPSDMFCADCGDEIESADYRDLSLIRHRRPLDRKCYMALKGAKK